MQYLCSTCPRPHAPLPVTPTPRGQDHPLFQMQKGYPDCREVEQLLNSRVAVGAGSPTCKHRPLFRVCWTHAERPLVSSSPDWTCHPSPGLFLSSGLPSIRLDCSLSTRPRSRRHLPVWAETPLSCRPSWPWGSFSSRWAHSPAPPPHSLPLGGLCKGSASPPTAPSPCHCSKGQR